MKRYNTWILITTLGIILWSCSTETTQKRAIESWVFRSVMDEQPRMITAALSNQLWVCFDAKNGDLYKIWKGGVNFDGAVYTTKHGPQPNTLGYAYYQNIMTETNWRVEKDGQSSVPGYNFKGYEIREGRLVFKYDLILTDGQLITVEDSPEYDQDGDAAGIHRTFTTSNVPSGYSLFQDIMLTSLIEEDAYSFDGDIAVNKVSSRYIQGIILYDLDARLYLKNNEKTTLVAHFHPGLENIKEEKTKEEAAVLPKGVELIQNSDCRTCHNETVKTVGPSYQEIAEKYAFTEESLVALATKIIKGGSGTWGQAQMSAHPDLAMEDAKDITTYILSLDGETLKVTNFNEKLFLDKPSVPFALAQDGGNPTNETEQAGLAINAYKCNSTIDILGYHKEHQPQYRGVTPVVHATKKSDLGPINELALFEIEGYINISSTSNYTFRLVNYDQSWLFIDGKEVISFAGWHKLDAKDGETYLSKGKHKIRIAYLQGSEGGGISFQWAKHGDNKFDIVPSAVLSFQENMLKNTADFVDLGVVDSRIPGFGGILQDLHPSFDLFQARPDDFQPRVGGIDFLPDGRMVMCTWDSLGPVYVIDGVQTGDPTKMTIKRIAQGLAEPLGIKVVDGQIYVLQKQELTLLIDHNGDELIDEYQTVCDDWTVTANFHEFAFGLEYQDGYFYGTLATAIMPGGAGGTNQAPDRGNVIKIGKDDGSIEFVAQGLRTPNGIGEAMNGKLFVCDNQGDWLPASKLVHVQKDAFYGSYAVHPDIMLPVTPPVIWMPQDEVGNSPSEPTYLNIGPYQNQIIYGEVTNGGIKRVFVEEVNGVLQGALFRFTQGLEAGVNRISWGPDGALYVGGIGVAGNWGQEGKLKYGLQRMVYNQKPTFEMLAVKSRANGFEIELTQPISDIERIDLSNFNVQQWRYVATSAYGGPKVDLKDLTIRSVSLTQDRKMIFLELPELKEGHVVYINILKPFVSKQGQNLWSGECWYTLNNKSNEVYKNIKPIQSIPDNTLTDIEKAAGWKLLFDGKTTEGWHNFKSDKIGSAWKVSNGTLTLDNSKKEGWQVIGGGDIVTEGTYENFELQLDWKISKGGNSGLIYKISQDDAYDYVWNTGPEMQILDNERHPDAQIAKHRAGDLYDLIRSKWEVQNPADEWNHVKLVCNNGKVSHHFNGFEIVSFEMYTDEWKKMVAESKFKDMPSFGTIKKGHIGLQDHGDKVWFKNIKIKEL